MQSGGLSFRAVFLGIGFDVGQKHCEGSADRRVFSFESARVVSLRAEIECARSHPDCLIDKVGGHFLGIPYLGSIISSATSIADDYRIVKHKYSELQRRKILSTTFFDARII
jgi:hypothetical protein